MRAYVSVDDGNNEQVTTLYETSTGGLRALGFPARRFFFPTLFLQITGSLCSASGY